MKFLIVLLLPLVSSAVALGAPTIKQINAGDEQIAVSASNETAIGSQWVASQKSGSQCVFEVTQTSGSVAIMEADSCDFAQLRVGQKLQKSLFSTATTSKTKRGPRWMSKLDGFSVIGFYSMADELPYKNNGTSVTANSKTAFGFGAEYEYDLYAVTDGLPLILVPGITYEMNREIENYSVNGQTITFQGAKANFSLWDVYVNAKYNLATAIGAFAGLNYSFPVESDFGNVNLKSDLGYQLGVTGELTDNFAVDGLYRWINMDGNNGVKDVSMDGLQIRGRYIF